MAKFRIPHLNEIYAKDQLLGAAMQQLEDAVNSIGLQTTASPVGSTGAPPNIASLTVSANNGLFEFEIIDHSPVLRGINYFIEISTTPNFSAPKVIDNGASRNGFIFLGNSTYYFRAYSAYPTSGRSDPVYFGTQSNPTAVNGGGVAPPAPLPAQGSGTTDGPTGGDGGFGNDPARGNLRDATL